MKELQLVHASFYTCTDTLTTLYIYKVKKKNVSNISLSFNAKWRKLTKPLQNIPSRIWPRTTNWATTNSSCSSQSHTKTKKKKNREKRKNPIFYIFSSYSNHPFLVSIPFSMFVYGVSCMFLICLRWWVVFPFFFSYFGVFCGLGGNKYVGGSWTTFLHSH